VRARVRMAALVAAAALLMPSCGVMGGGGDTVTAFATFDDVADLANGAPVHYADVLVGSVTSIELDETGTRANLSMEIDRAADVPANVEARIRRTTPLGEKFVELRPLGDVDEGGALADGTTIVRTEVVPDVEQLIASGTDLFAALSASEIAVLLDEGAEAFGGKGPQLRELLGDLGDVVHGYSTRTDTIAALVDAIDELAAATGPAAEANATSIAHLAETTRILDEQDDRLFDLVRSLDRLAIEGRSILDAHMDEMAIQIDGLRSVTSAIAREQVALGNILEYTPAHNEALERGVKDDFVQVLNDFVICGLPGGGEDPSSPLNSCSYVPSAQGDGR
jgi:phospholipid/cholesterol/gamma-HCH transport system substrate-binding protein